MIAVLGMSVLTGFTRLFSFGNAGFMSIGAYAAAICSVEYHMPFVVSILIGAAAAGAVSYVLGSLTIRLRGDYFLISCLGFGECVRVLFNYTKSITGGANGYSNIPYKTTGIVAIICTVLAFIIAWNFIHSRYGQALSAIRENELAAAANGINVVRYKKMSFVFSAIYAGWAGGLYAHYLRFITPTLFNLGKSSELVITTVLGGLGSLTRKCVGNDHCTDSAGDLPKHVRIPYAVLRNRSSTHDTLTSGRIIRIPGVQSETSDCQNHEPWKK